MPPSSRDKCSPDKHHIGSVQECIVSLIQSLIIPSQIQKYDMVFIINRAVLPHRTFFKVLYFFFHNFKILYFFCTFLRPCTFFCTFFSSIWLSFAKFFSKVLFLYFFWSFCKMNVLLIYNLQGFLYKYPIECLRLQEMGVNSLTLPPPNGHLGGPMSQILKAYFF